VAVTEQPVTEAEFAALMRLFEPFERRPVLALAVSGGRDSRALALLARRWAARRGGRAVALVVDHGLRPASADEARRTREWLALQQIEAHILRWRPTAPPTAGVQAAARAARYRLLLAWCARHGILHLLTAHQADDQAETFVMRRTRDSGATGLAGMSAVVEFPQARLLRPLLPVPRARLTATLQSRGETWIDDPSNLDPRFARTALRTTGPSMSLPAATRQANGFALQRVQEEAQLAAALAECVLPHPLGAMTIDHGPWCALPAPTSQAVLAAVVATTAGADYPPRRVRCAAAAARMRTAAPQPGRLPGGLTLGGCRILWRSGGWLVVREPASIGTAACMADALKWDGRFEIFWPDGKAQAAHAGPVALGTAARARQWRDAWPATPGLPAILPGLPAMASGSAVMPLQIRGGAGPAKPLRDRPLACFRPRRALAPGPFFPCFASGEGQIVKRTTGTRSWRLRSACPGAKPSGRMRST
jgi:tRNA(Ile)-lysidine synthase